LSEHLMGKPTQRHEMTGEEGGPIVAHFDLNGLTDDQLDRLAASLKD
jgi:hypothetical protein